MKQGKITLYLGKSISKIILSKCANMFIKAFWSRFRQKIKNALIEDVADINRKIVKVLNVKKLNASIDLTLVEEPLVDAKNLNLKFNGDVFPIGGTPSIVNPKEIFAVDSTNSSQIFAHQTIVNRLVNVILNSYKRKFSSSTRQGSMITNIDTRALGEVLPLIQDLNPPEFVMLNSTVSGLRPANVTFEHDLINIDLFVQGAVVLDNPEKTVYINSLNFTVKLQISTINDLKDLTFRLAKIDMYGYEINQKDLGTRINIEAFDFDKPILMSFMRSIINDRLFYSNPIDLKKLLKINATDFGLDIHSHWVELRINP